MGVMRDDTCNYDVSKTTTSNADDIHSLDVKEIKKPNFIMINKEIIPYNSQTFSSRVELKNRDGPTGTPRHDAAMYMRSVHGRYSPHPRSPVPVASEDVQFFNLSPKSSWSRTPSSGARHATLF
ncbi:unnamed protein product [Ectocarpus sp. 13 AM-2016]